MSEHSDVMPGPANPAMQAGGAQKGGRHIGKFKKRLLFMLQLCFHVKSLYKMTIFFRIFNQTHNFRLDF